MTFVYQLLLLLQPFYGPSYIKRLVIQLTFTAQGCYSLRS